MSGQGEWGDIQYACAGDLEQILHIEEACFSTPWTRKMLQAELSGNPFAHFLIATGSGIEEGPRQVVGYVCFWLLFEELRIMNLAIEASARRRGIARRLVTTTLHIGRDKGASRALLEVRASNEPALLLYGGMGFQRVSTRTGYYSHPTEDAILMEMSPLSVPAIPGHLHPIVTCEELGNGPSLQPGGTTC